MGNPHEVILIDSSPKPKVEIEEEPDVIILDDKDDQNEAPATSSRRFSQLFNEFRAKWTRERRYETVAVEDCINDKESIPRCLDVQDIQDSVKEKTRSQSVKEKTKSLSKRVKKTRETAKTQTTAKGNQPKNKMQSLREIECVVDRLLQDKVDCGKFSDLLAVKHEDLYFSFPAIMWRHVGTKDWHRWVVGVFKMSEDFLTTRDAIIKRFKEETEMYEKRAILLTEWRPFVVDYEKRAQKSFNQALKKGHRFSGSAFINLDEWRHSLFADCMANDISLIEMDMHGPASLLIENWIMEASKAIAWHEHKHLKLTSFKTPGRCGRDAREVFRKMLECIPRMPIAAIDALAILFDSPLKFVEFASSRGPDGIANIAISEQRTIGPVLGEKLHRLFAGRFGEGELFLV